MQAVDIRRKNTENNNDSGKYSPDLRTVQTKMLYAKKYGDGLNDLSGGVLACPPYPSIIIISGGLGGWGIDSVHFLGVADEVVFIPLCVILGVLSGVMYALGARRNGGSAVILEG
jgi:hypothetical protein